MLSQLENRLGGERRLSLLDGMDPVLPHVPGPSHLPLPLLCLLLLLLLLLLRLPRLLSLLFGEQLPLLPFSATTPKTVAAGRGVGKGRGLGGPRKVVGCTRTLHQSLQGAIMTRGVAFREKGCVVSPCSCRFSLLHSHRRRSRVWNTSNHDPTYKIYTDTNLSKWWTPTP